MEFVEFLCIATLGLLIAQVVAIVGALAHGSRALIARSRTRDVGGAFAETSAP